jgi:anaerobic selenocysteine-containing dehydrogenase
VREPGGFYLPNAPREGKFNTPSEKAHFSVVYPDRIVLTPGELMMMTVRSHDQFNTTIYGMHDRYRGIYNERRVVFLNEEDMLAQGLQKGDVVDLSSHYNGVVRTADKFVVVPYSIPPGCAATYYPETNVLVPIDSTAAGSNTPVSKGVIIRLTKAG